jgi:TolA-binding protein
MKPCEHLSHYLDGRLERAGRDYFEAHLHICPECQKIVNTWCGTKAGLKKEALDRLYYLTPTEEEAARIVERAELDQAPRTTWILQNLLPIGVTACVTLGLSLMMAMLIADGAPGEETEDRVTRPLVGITSRLVQYEATMDGNTIGRLGFDRFGLRPSSQLSVLSTDDKTTRLKLEKGTAAFSVASRAKGREFIVEAGNCDVKVVGTKFSVTRNDGEDVRVSVIEGKVVVEGRDGRQWRVSAGETLAVSGKAGSKSPSTEEESAMVGWILGEVDSDTFMNLTARADAPEADPEDEVAMVFEITAEDATGGLVPSLVKTGVGNPLQPGAGQVNSKLANGGGVQGAALPNLKSSAKGGLAGDGKPGATAKREGDLPLADELRGVDLYRQWVLEGKLAEAEAALSQHLATHSIDTEAMSLLADCRRKAGKYNEALDTYKTLMAVAGTHQANRARFKAAVLMQEQLNDHFGAASNFEEYLASGTGSPLLKAKATVRLSRSLIALGERIRARKLLKQVIQTHGGTSTAIQAREILDKLN